MMTGTVGDVEPEVLPPGTAAAGRFRRGGEHRLREGPRLAVRIQPVAIERRSDLAEPLRAEPAPVGELVV
jgi:hypothetical protein